MNNCPLIPRHSRVPRLLCLALLVLLSACTFARAQSFALTDGRLPVTSLNGRWRFHAGDNPAWANPSFDDSGWSLLRSDRGWNIQGYHGYSGMGWYRFQVVVPASLDRISLDLPHILTCYEVYADGVLLGRYGKMPPDPIPYSGGFNRIYPLPRAEHQARKITFAIRVWHWPALAPYYGGGPLYGDGMVGKSDEIWLLDRQLRANRHWIFNSTLILALLQTLAATGSLFLFFLRRSEREYVFFCLVLLSSAGPSWLALSYYFDVWPLVLHNQIEAALVGPCLSLAEIAFYFYLLKGKRTPLFWIAVVSSIVSVFYNFLFGRQGSNSASWFLGQDLLIFPVYIWILSLLFVRARQNYEDARLLAAPVVLQKTCLVFQQLSVLTFVWGLQSKFDFRIWLTDWPFRIELVQLVDVLFLLTMLAILLLRFTRTRSQEERYATELDGARSVQQFLIPRQIPDIPGLRFESEYRPAREVGGDFFQVLPDPLDGSVLIIIGDVAGKGLQAGMLATLIVGALRTAATFSTDPVLILHTLNNRLCGRGNATGLALRIASDGTVTLVNAGHLPPYLNGRELPMEGALPLGTIPGIDFPVFKFKLTEGDSLMLMSDGIIEAQDQDGQLFGFERTAELLSNNTSAAALATAAQNFGQSDDITVLTISRIRQDIPSQTLPQPIHA